MRRVSTGAARAPRWSLGRGGAPWWGGSSGALDSLKRELRQSSAVAVGSDGNQLLNADGEPRYTTSTSRPNTLHRGRIARSRVPVFERTGSIPSRRTLGLTSLMKMSPRVIARAAATLGSYFATAEPLEVAVGNCASHAVHGAAEARIGAQL